MPATVVIRGGIVVDGLGGPPRQADVVIDGDRILGIEPEVGEVDAQVLDASGLVVAPGFINTLSHAWASLQYDRSGPSDVLQGVTTEVFGEAFSLGPTSPAIAQVISEEGLPEGVRVHYDRLSEGLSALESAGIGPNVASLVGATNLRALGAGLEDRRFTPAEADRVAAVLREELQEGALGVGTALIYAPGTFADTDELVALCDVVAEYDGLYTSHLRSEGDRLLECLDELVEIARRSGARAEVYHLKAAGRSNWPKMAQAIDRIAAARDEGLPITASMYPYTAGGTALMAAVPPRFADGGPLALLERIADPSVRPDVVAAIREPGADWENLYLAAGGGAGIVLVHPDGNRSLAAIAEERGADEVEALIDLVLEDPTAGALYFIIAEENIQLGLRQPWVSIGSDASAPDVRGPEAAGPTHPRAYGTFARILGRYVREERLVPLEEAVRRMTSLPADVFRLTGRGRLEPHAFADVAVFDPLAIADLATYEDSHRYATGVRHVLVNGQLVVEEGAVTGTLPGRRLRRAFAG